MNDKTIESLLSNLNSISRMAIIENASKTEKMLCNFTKIIKYMYGEKDKFVMASTELNCINKICKFYKIYMKGYFDSNIEENTIWDNIFVPHFTMCSIIYSLLECINYEDAKIFKIDIRALNNHKKNKIQIMIIGEKDYETLLKKAYSFKGFSKLTMKSALNKIENTDKFKVNIEIKNYKSLSIIFSIENDIGDIWYVK